MTAPRLLSLRLSDIVEAIDHIRSVLDGASPDDFERDWQRRWLVERGIEIISEASRHLPEELKDRHVVIPWRKVGASAMFFGTITNGLRLTFCGKWPGTICRRLRRFAARNSPLRSSASADYEDKL